MKNIPYAVRRILQKTILVSEEEHHVKNEDKINESHKSQLKF